MTMKWSISCGVLAVVLAVSAAMAGEPTKEPAKGSVPTDKKVPTINYIVASPRAYLTGGMMGPIIDYSAMTGAAENFARPAVAKARLVEVPVGTRVVFSLDPESEGVWMEGAHGMIGTLLTLQRLVVKDCAECDKSAADANSAADSAREVQASAQGTRGDSNDVASPVDPNKMPTRRPAQVAKWIPIATDGVRDIRFGPSIGWARKVGVPVRFDKPGVYCLRGIVSTSVRTWRPLAAAKRPMGRAGEKPDVALTPDKLLALDVDIVHVAVRVVDQPAKGTDKTTTDPNGTPGKVPAGSKEGQGDTTDKDTTHTGDMVKIMGMEALDLDEGSLGDLGALVGQEEGDFVLPTE